MSLIVMVTLNAHGNNKLDHHHVPLDTLLSPSSPTMSTDDVDFESNTKDGGADTTLDLGVVIPNQPENFPPDGECDNVDDDGLRHILPLHLPRRNRRPIVVHTQETPSRQLILRMVDLREELDKINSRIMSGLAVSQEDWNAVRKLAGDAFEDVIFDWERITEEKYK